VTLRRAKDKFDVVIRRTGGIGSAGSWEWSLPDGATEAEGDNRGFA
jgi:hypothetical protein